MGRAQIAEKPRLGAGDKVRHYRVLRLLGKGGGGEVYVARDTQLGRKVALKMIRPAMLGSKEAVERFIFEARATARFNHPHIITIYEVGTFEGAPYVALEYLEGRSLRQFLRGQRLQVKEAVRVALAVSEALEEAHGAGILHRDLKPENIYVPRDGRLRVLDFGLAKRLEKGPVQGSTLVSDAEERVDEEISPTAPTEGDTELASSPPGSEGEQTLAPPAGDDEAEMTLGHFGSRGFDSSSRRGVRGTPPYMAPEQWRMEQQSSKTDIWALGVMLYELVTGLLPFSSLDRSCIRSSVLASEPMPRLSTEGGLPEALVELIARCLDKNAARRPDAGEVRRGLAELLVPSSVDLAEIQGPFRGLFAFDERHAHLFFGRDAEIAAFVEQLRSESAIAVLGPTGAGKSSFVQAGVVPRLREQGPWVVLRVRPGHDPFRALAARLVAGDALSDHFSSSITGASSGKERMLADELRAEPLKLGLMLRQMAEDQQVRVLLLVDQLEELHTQAANDEDSQRFLAALASAADEADEPVRLVVTLRDDFLGKVAVGEAASHVLGRVVVLRRPDGAALREIITRAPVEFGYDYDDSALVSEMIAEVAHEQACLPLLSFAGRTLWEHRDRERRRLTREAYRQMGGVVGALATHGDGVIEALSPAGREQARRLLQRLVTAENTRRLVERDALLEGLEREAEEVLARLIEARLVVIRRHSVADQSCELAHEALIGGWQQLARWLDESREERVFAQELEQAAALWSRRGRREDEVWRDEALREALAGVKQFALSPGQEVAEFLQLAQHRQRRREQTRQRRKRIVGFSVVFGVLLALGLLAGWGLTLRAKADEARRERARAEDQLAAAQRQGAMLALDQGKTLRARALIRSALERKVEPRARRLWWEVSYRPRLWRHRLAQRPRRAVFAPDGRSVVLTLSAGPVLQLDLASLEQKVLASAKEMVLDVAFSAEHELAMIAKGGAITLLDLRTQTRRALGRHLDRGNAAGRRLLALPRKKLLYSFNRRLMRWSLGSKREPEVTELGYGGRLVGVADKEVVTGSGFPSVTLHRAGRRFHHLPRAHNRAVGLVDVSSDGKLVASVSVEKHAMLEVHRRDEKRSCRINTRRWISGLRLSPDGRWLALGSRDAYLQLWDARRCLLVSEVNLAVEERFLGPGMRVWTVLVAFDAQGKRLLAGTMHGELQLFDVAKLAAAGRGGHAKALRALKFTPDGQELISGDVGGKLRVWDRQGRLRRQATLDCSIHRLLVDGARGMLYVGCVRGASRKLDLRTLRPLARYQAGPVRVIAIALSPDGRWLAGASDDGQVHLWEAESGKRISTFAPKTGATELLFDASGRLLTVGPKTRSLAFYGLPKAVLERELSLPRGMGNSGAVGLQLMRDGRIALRLGAHDVWSIDPSSGKKELLAPSRGPVYVRPILAPDDDQTIVVPYDVGHGQGAGFLLGQRKTRKARLFFGARGRLTSLAFDSQKELVASGSVDGQLSIWRRKTGRPLRHTTLLSASPPRLYSSAGIREQPTGSARPGKKKWQQNLSNEGWLAALDQSGRWLCLATFDRQAELWDVREDRRVMRVPRVGIAEVQALGRACVLRWKKGAELLALGAAPRMLATDAIAIGRAEEQALVVRKGGEIERFDLEGVRRQSWPRLLVSPQTMTAAKEGMLLAQTGQLGLLRAGERKVMRLPLASRPTIARFLSQQVVVVGYASGELEAYQIADGRKLLHLRLEGGVSHLARRGQSLHVATEQGDWRIVDISALTLDECALLRRLWSSSKARWSGGEVVRAERPAAHRCALP